MANLMSIFLKFFMKLKFWQFPEKQVSRKIERNLTVRPIELIETGIEVSTPSLYPEHINKEKVFRKLFTQKEGGVPLSELDKSAEANVVFYFLKNSVSAEFPIDVVNRISRPWESPCHVNAIADGRNWSRRPEQDLWSWPTFHLSFFSSTIRLSFRNVSLSNVNVLISIWWSTSSSIDLLVKNEWKQNDCDSVFYSNQFYIKGKDNQRE